MSFVPGSRQARREKGRPGTALLSVAGLVIAAVAAIVLCTPSRAAGPSAIGIDMTPNAANTSSTDKIDPCTEVKAGDQFAADVFVTNLDSLKAWELRVEFDPAIVSLESADYNFLLVKTGGQVFPSEFEQEKPGRMFLAAAETQFPHSGSGVLARLHLKALAGGTSSLTVMSSPTYFGPRLTGAAGIPVGDTNGDGYFDGPITGGTVDVGRSCPSATQAVTPPTGGSTPAPGAPTPATTEAPQGGPTDGSSGPPGAGNGHNSAAGGGPIAIEASPGSSPAGAGPSQGVSSPAVRSGVDPGSGEQPNVAGTADPAAQGGGGSGASKVLTVSGIAAALAIIAGAALLFYRRRRATDM